MSPVQKNHKSCQLSVINLSYQSFCFEPLLILTKGSQFILRRFSFQIYFATVFVPNLFCDGFRSKFILRRLFSFQIYFATVVFVPNLFCDGFRSKFILRRLFSFQIYFAMVFVPNLFCEVVLEINNDPFFGNAPLPCNLWQHNNN
ncbi:MAG: hypothetical protein DRR00_10480 [Candidatus Parabeggiatoa sp. nov. 3]|nr:MAG: hypothetical protein DRR00_10480 [Gammaproteobacteria bacterium]RKZ58450.1 MAG: hypothetical protein DRQ99_25415 [Gammaproteobacteria bacterium]